MGGRALPSPSSLAVRRGFRRRTVAGHDWRHKRVFDDRRGDDIRREFDRRDGIDPRADPRRDRDARISPPMYRRFQAFDDSVHWLDNVEGQGALSRIRLILVGTQTPGNIGAVCRAASNFECRDVWLVNPECDYHADEARCMATNPSAKTILEELSVTNSLREALAECQMAIGFTRRDRREDIADMQFQMIRYPPRGVITGLVFGREDDGLTNEEMAYCTHLCTIPTSKWDGSLNLSHAVTLGLGKYFNRYRLHASTGKERVPDPKIHYHEETAPHQELHFLLDRWRHVVMNANVAASLVLKPEVKMTRIFLKHMKRILYKGRPTVREAKALHGFLSLVEGNSHTVGNLVCHMETRDSGEEEDEEEDYDTFLQRAAADERASDDIKNWPGDESPDDTDAEEAYLRRRRVADELAG